MAKIYSKAGKNTLYLARQRRLRETMAALEPGMTMCVEVYVGSANHGESVKLEQHLLVTEQGPEVLSCYPFDDMLLPREV